MKLHQRSGKEGWSGEAEDEGWKGSGGGVRKVRFVEVEVLAAQMDQGFLTDLVELLAAQVDHPCDSVR